MSELYNAFRMGIVLVFAALVVYLGAQIVPQIQTAAVLPARISADNAQALADAAAAPTFTALKVSATAQAIQNERTAAAAAANAQTIQAQAIAERERMNAGTFNLAVMGALVLLAIAIAILGAVIMLRTLSAQRTHRAAIELAQRTGGMLELPNGHRIAFENARKPFELAPDATNVDEIGAQRRTAPARFDP